MYLKRTVQKDVYVADLTPTGDVANPRRLTLDDRTDIALNWTPDGSAILFSSDRNGSSDIFRQRLDQRTAEPVIEGSDDETGPLAVSRGGRMDDYLVAPPAARLTPAAGRAIMRMRATGGAREKIADDSSQHSVLCPRPGATTGCVPVEQVDTEVSVYQATGEAVRRQKLTGTTIVRGTPVRADLIAGRFVGGNPDRAARAHSRSAAQRWQARRAREGSSRRRHVLLVG